MRAIAQAAALAAVVVCAAGCGAEKRDAAAVAGCLNGHSFLVQATGSRIDGSSPAGVGLTLTVRRGRASALDTSGSPGKERLSPQDRSTIASCLAKHGPQPGTLTTPAAR